MALCGLSKDIVRYGGDEVVVSEPKVGSGSVPEVLDGACHADAGIVDKDINLSIYCQGSIELFVQIVGGHVEGYPSASERLDLRHYFGGLVGIA